MITPIGLALFVIMGCFLVLARRHFIWFLAAMIPFPQVAMFVVAGQGISPFYAAAIPATFMGVSATLKAMLRDRGSFKPIRGPQARLLALFATYAVLVSVIGPILFEGVGVFSPRLGINDQLVRQTPLAFTISNFAQIMYLLLGLGVIVYVLSLPHLPPRILETGIWVGLLFTFINALYLQAGLAFPREFFDTIPTIYYQAGGRLRGPFAEPSVLGAFLTASVAYLAHRAIVNTGRARVTAVVGIVVGLWEYVLSASGTALAGLGIVAVIAILISFTKWVSAGAPGIDRLSIIALALLATVIAFWARVAGFTAELVSDKLVSDSYSDRTGADQYALTLVLKTWGIGVGLGSNRPSSLGAMLLSCVGIVGTGLLIVLVIRAALRTRALGSEYAGSAWALLGVSIAMAIAKADLATPMIWMALAFCMYVSTYGGDSKPHDFTPGPLPPASHRGSGRLASRTHEALGHERRRRAGSIGTATTDLE